MTISPCYLIPDMPPGLEPLAELALDMRCSWNHASDQLWKQLDKKLWEQTRNPWLILQSASEKRLHELVADEAFMAQLEQIIQDYHNALGGDSWFSLQGLTDKLHGVAYFSMEFGLSEVLPIYSGGLGILAGDCLKTASDLSVPMIGIGLLYQQGYFRQILDAEGNQQELYPYNDPIQMPVMPVRNKSGEWLRVKIRLPGRVLRLAVWQAIVGRVRLYLLDSNDPLNSPADRGITGELYGGGQETRILQEMVLGIGGWRVLETLGLSPEVCHLNEGHAAFAILERANCFAQQNNCNFEEALTATRAGNLFTTHTPIAAGFDQFTPQLIRQYLSDYCTELGIDIEHLLNLGRNQISNPNEPFNMAWLAIHGACAVNAVSRLHGEVSRSIFQPLFPRWPLSEIPVSHVTNGIHVPSWDSVKADDFWTNACGKQRWLGNLETTEHNIKQLADETFWTMRTNSRLQLIHYARRRLQQQIAEASGGQTVDTSELLDPNALTLCFSRRFTSYKRPNLLLTDPPRLARLLTNPQRPVQMIIAGKAHPKDEPGKAMICEWNQFIQNFQLQNHIVFISDYDIRVAEELVQGADVWINTPRRPWEASGTSGMKVLANGGLNLSELDGWWAEAWTPEVGWAIGDRYEHGDDPVWDAAEADALYRILEQEVIPQFYQRDVHGVPREWVAKMRTSMAELTPRFSTNRMLREYTEDLYIGLAEAYKRREAKGGKLARELEAWKKTIQCHWQKLHFGDLNVYSDESGHHFLVAVYLDDMPLDAVRVELFAESLDATAPEVYEMNRDEPLSGAVNGYLYSCTVVSNRIASDFTPRIIPHHPNAIVPIEAKEILWQH